LLDVRSILSILASNIKATGLPVPAPREALYSWSEGLSIPKDGDTLLYTGGLYQLLPYIEVYSSQLAKLEDKRSGGLLLRAAGRFSSLSRIAGAIVRPSKREVEESKRILQSIVRLLDAAGVRVAYRREVDGYSGVLLYDMGLDDDFKKHFAQVARSLAQTGARTIVTVDPHTTHVLRSVARRLGLLPELEVKTYLELLAENIDNINFKKGRAGTAAIHDSCLYARRENVIAQPRLLLERAGYQILEPRRSGRLTYCCGGPIESIAPKLSSRIALARIGELADTGAERIATMCPICLANLKRASRTAGGPPVVDLSLLLAERLEA